MQTKKKNSKENSDKNFKLIFLGKSWGDSWRIPTLISWNFPRGYCSSSFTEFRQYIFQKSNCGVVPSISISRNFHSILPGICIYDFLKKTSEFLQKTSLRFIRVFYFKYRYVFLWIFEKFLILEAQFEIYPIYLSLCNFICGIWPMSIILTFFYRFWKRFR